MSHDKDSYVVAWASFRIVLTCFFMAVTSFSRPVSSKLLVANSDAGWLKYPRYGTQNLHFEMVASIG